MANIIKRVWNQNRMVQIEDLRGMTFQAEAAGHTFQISGIDDDGNTVALTGTPSGVLLRPDNTDVALTCSVSGGVVSATLPANCYDVPGRFGLTIFITSGSSKTAIYAAVGTVTRTSSGTVAPGTSQSVVDLINAINAAVNSIPASYSALLADIAPTYSNSALYSVGQYAWYDGDLKRCIVPITTAESYTAAHWTSAVLGQDVSDLKSAIDGLNGAIDELESVTVERVISANKWNPNTTTPDSYYLSDGSIATNANYVLSDYIDVSGSNYLLCCSQYGSGSFTFMCDGIVFFDSTKTFISGSKSTNLNAAVSVPNGAKFVRAWFQKVENQKYVGLSDTTVLPVYEEYYNYLKNILGDDVSTLLDLTLADYESANKWNPNATTDGKYYLSDGSLSDNANYVLSDYIPVGNYAYVLPCAQFGSNPFKFLADGGVFFDSGKNFISGSKITTQTAYAVPNGASYVRVWFQKVDNQIYVGLSDSDALPTYEEYFVGKQNAMESRMDAVENKLIEAETDRVVCWGDSLTDGAGATGTPANGYPERLQTLITSGGNNLTVANAGIGGEDSYAIGFRQGGIELQIDPFTIPASGASSAVTIHEWNGREVEILKRGGTNVTVNYPKLRLNPVTIAGVPGDLLRNNNGDIVFTRSSSGSAVTVSRPVPIFVDALANYNLDTDITIIWAGTNNIHDTSDVSVIIDSIKAMIAMLKNKKYIVIGLTCKQVFSDIESMNFSMANAFDKHFLNVRDYLLEYGLSDEGITPTAQDVTDITNGEIPTSLRSDYVHLNNNGYQVVAEQVYKKGQQLGYWK